MRSPAVQFFLIALAVLSAFTLGSPRNGVRETVQMLFVPVSAPTRAVVRWATERTSSQQEIDVLSPDKPRDINSVLQQNAMLLTRLGSLEAQFEDLKQLSAQYRDLNPDLRRRVDPAAVVAGSTTGRQTLTISTGGLPAVRERAAVVHPSGFVGQIYAVAVGEATARVLLATDPESRLAARFVRYETTEDGSVQTFALRTQPPLVEGNGRNLIVRMLPAGEVRNTLRVGDVAQLDDPTFPLVTKGLRLGTVRRIQLPPTDAGHATVELDPTTDFGGLREVLVVDR